MLVLLMLTTVLYFSVGECTKNCSGHGVCENGTCVCDVGYLGSYCEVVSCPNNCSARGSCVHGACVCLASYKGEICPASFKGERGAQSSGVGGGSVQVGWLNWMSEVGS